jgi:hypothetical protein
VITLTNEFHGTRVTLRHVPSFDLSHRQVLEARHALCGVTNCECGAGALGEIGPGNPVIEVRGTDEAGHIYYRATPTSSPSTRPGLIFQVRLSSSETARLEQLGGGDWIRAMLNRTR